MIEITQEDLRQAKTASIDEVMQMVAEGEGILSSNIVNVALNHPDCKDEHRLALLQLPDRANMQFAAFAILGKENVSSELLDFIEANLEGMLADKARSLREKGASAAKESERPGSFWE